MGVLQVSRVTTGHLNNIRLGIHGDAGALRIDLDADYDALDVCLGEDVHEARWRRVEAAPVPSVAEEFIATIRGEATASPVPVPDFTRGARVQAWLEACFDSSESGRPVKIVR